MAQGCMAHPSCVLHWLHVPTLTFFKPSKGPFGARRLAQVLQFRATCITCLACAVVLQHCHASVTYRAQYPAVLQCVGYLSCTSSEGCLGDTRGLGTRCACSSLPKCWECDCADQP
jgi:hypothetical protein